MKGIRSGKRAAIVAGLGVLGVAVLGAVFWKDFAARYYTSKLSDKDAKQRVKAVESLKVMGPRALPELFKALKDEDGEVRIAAACTIEKIRPVEEDTVLTLINFLEDERAEVRSSSLLALSLVDGEKLSSLPAVIGKLKDESVSVRVLAAGTLLDFSTKCKSLIDVGDSEILSKFGVAVTALIEALSDQDQNVRLCAAMALRPLGALAKSAIPALELLAKDQNKFVAEAALLALGEIGLNESMGIFIQALKDSDPNVSSTAAELLLKIGAKPAIDALCESFKSRRYKLRKSILEFLGRNKSPFSIPIFVEALKDPDGSNRRIAAEFLGEMGPEARDAVPALQAALADLDLGVREAAQKALKKIEEAETK